MNQDSPASLPELGPYLGRLAEPTRRFEDPTVGLDQVRLDLVSDLFERAGSARGFLMTGDSGGARAALDRAGWLEIWRVAAGKAADRTMTSLTDRLERAGRRSGFPRRRLRALLPTAEDRAALATKLEAAGIPLEQRLARGFPSGDGWWEGLRLAATALEESWDQLEDVVRQEVAAGEAVARRVDAWRPPRAPWIAGLVVALALVTWLGLALGGFLPRPRWLDPLANWIWSLPWP